MEVNKLPIVVTAVALVSFGAGYAAAMQRPPIVYKDQTLEALHQVTMSGMTVQLDMYGGDKGIECRQINFEDVNRAHQQKMIGALLMRSAEHNDPVSFDKAVTHSRTMQCKPMDDK